MEQYKDFAFVYDELMNEVDYNGWVKYIEDIIKNINKLLSSGKIEYINQVKSLEKLLNVLNVKVVNYKDGFKLKNK